jgi:hypothetical protein
LVYVGGFDVSFHEVPMSGEELLLGFDGRVWGSSDSWDAKRREQFLVRTDVVQPFSTDTTVWPAVKDSDLRPPTCIGHQTLWNDLECLQSCLGSAATSRPLIIAVTLHLIKEPSDEVDRWKADVPETIPAFRAEPWSLLGYDVSDRWLLSGLSNCGFLPGDDVQALREKWSDKLSDHHLFERLESAVEFRALSDQRIVEHSPFFVFGIWSIPSGVSVVLESSM